MILHTFTNEEDQMEAYVSKAGDAGFRVSIIDLDSGFFLPVTYGIATEDKAIDKAKAAINN